MSQLGKQENLADTAPTPNVIQLFLSHVSLVAVTLAVCTGLYATSHIQLIVLMVHQDILSVEVCFFSQKKTAG